MRTVLMLPAALIVGIAACTSQPVDPFPSRPAPGVPVAAQWDALAPGQYEAHALAAMREEAHRAKLKVGYPGTFAAATNVVGADGRPLRLAALPTVDLACRKIDGHYDAGREVIAWIGVKSEGAPKLFVGESLPELANENPKFFEQTTEMTNVAPGTWRTMAPLAFRYFRFAAPVKDVRVDAEFTPAADHGAFSSPSRRLEDIRERAAYTLRLCMRTFLIDGVKRDRLPWGGDLAVSLLSDCYTFHDPDPIRRSLTVLDSAGPGGGDVNGIVDYSLWTIICHDYYQTHFADRDFLAKRYDGIRRRLDSFAAREDTDGFLAKDVKWLFIDWTEPKSTTALQILYYAALEAGARLADRQGAAADAARWRGRAAKLRVAIRRAAFDPKSGLFRTDLRDASVTATRHPNIFALVFGVAEPAERTKIADTLLAAADLPPVGTPFVATFEAMALAKCGRGAAFMKVIEKTWGGMLDAGATTFWEAWNPSKADDTRYAFYGRPFALSLCHAWSSGPAFLLPQELCGIRPLEDGWKTFEVRPLPEAAGCACQIPTPSGNIEIAIGKDLKVTVSGAVLANDGNDSIFIIK